MKIVSKYLCVDQEIHGYEEFGEKTLNSVLIVLFYLNCVITYRETQRK